MAQDRPELRELIELWDRADRACQDTSDIIADRLKWLERSEAVLHEHSAQLRLTRDLIARSKALLAKTPGRGTPAKGKAVTGIVQGMNSVGKLQFCPRSPLSYRS